MDKKKKKNRMKEKSFWEQDGVLKIVFGLLIVAVLILTVLVFQKNQDSKKEVSSDLVIPIVGENTDFAFNINALALSNSDEYVFKITNYQKDTINDDTISYEVQILNKTNAVIEVTKDDEEKDLMQEQASTIIVGENIPGGEKFDTYYHVKMIQTTALDSKEFIQVKIEAKEQ